jgi:hypothetical protein
VLQEVERKHYADKYKQMMRGGGNSGVRGGAGSLTPAISLSAMVTRHGPFDNDRERERERDRDRVVPLSLNVGPSVSKKQNDLSEIKNYLAEFTLSSQQHGGVSGGGGMTYYSHLRREIEGLVPAMASIGGNSAAMHPSIAPQSAMNQAIGLNRHGVGYPAQDKMREQERESHHSKYSSALSTDFSTWQRYRR